VNPKISGDFVAIEDLSEGDYHIVLWHVPTDSLFRVTTSPGAQFLNDIDGKRIVYTDDRNGQLDIYLFEFEVVFPEEPPTGICRDYVLEAAKLYSPSRWTDAQVDLANPMAFVLPEVIPVTQGNSGNHWITLTWRLGDSQFKCRYRGGSDQAHPQDEAELAKATQYVFWHCSDDAAQPGDVLSADSVRLHLDNGDSWAGETRVAMLLHEVAPCAGTGEDPGSVTPDDPGCPGIDPDLLELFGCSQVGAGFWFPALLMILGFFAIRPLAPARRRTRR